MSGILKREILFSWMPLVAGNINGQRVLRTADCAICVTSIGNCVEPFTIDDRHAMDGMPASLDPKDMMRRIDGIISHDYTGESNLFSDEGTVLHEYKQWIIEGP